MIFQYSSSVRPSSAQIVIYKFFFLDLGTLSVWNNVWKQGWVRESHENEAPGMLYSYQIIDTLDDCRVLCWLKRRHQGNHPWSLADLILQLWWILPPLPDK